MRLFWLCLAVVMLWATPCLAAFPTVVGTSTTAEATSVTTHTVNIGSPANGQLVVVIMGCRNAGSVNALAGWTELADSAASTSTLWVAYRRADGTEGATISPVTTSASGCGAVAYRITGHHGSSNPEIGTTASNTSGSSTAPDPSAVTASWGAEENLFIALEVHAAGTDTTAAPTSYTPLLEGHGTSTGSTAGSAAAAIRELTNSTDNPTAFSMAFANVWQANTIVIRPAGGGGGGGGGTLTVAATATTSNTTADVTTHTVNLPTGIASGDLLLVIMGGRNGGTVNALTGWTELVDAAAATGNLWIACRVADGSEGSTISPVSTLDYREAAVALRITGQHSTGCASGGVEVGTTASDTSGSSTAPNPPTITPTWGSAETLWIAAAGIGGQVTFSAYPTDYTDNNLSAAATGGTDRGSAAVATRTFTATSQDPGAFTINTGAVWLTNTIAVRPAVAAAGGARVIGGGFGGFID